MPAASLNTATGLLTCLESVQYGICAWAGRQSKPCGSRAGDPTRCEASNEMSAVEKRALSVVREDESTLLVRCAGAWRLSDGIPSLEAVEQQLGERPPQRVRFETESLAQWDSGFLTFLGRLLSLCEKKGVDVDRRGLPGGARRLLELSEVVPEKVEARAHEIQASILVRIGTATLSKRDALLAMLGFLGELARGFFRLMTGRARFRSSDLFLFVQQAGAEALPIVSLISFLVGLILAFVGAVQLRQFGASIYVANLVAIAMVREMGAMMTAIVMAGRTGASYAAQLGSMKVTQEIDALSTMGISPLDFLVLPRMIALALMMPLLCLYSDLLGIIGGAAVGLGMLDLSMTAYARQTLASVDGTDLVGGVFKAMVYGVLIAFAGCLRGMQSGNSSMAVGEATTSAVVTSIVLIISACGVFAVVFYILGI